MQPKIYKMFYALVTFLQYLKNIKQVISLGGRGKTTPLFYIPNSSVISFWCTKHAYIILGCIAYKFKRGVDASQANLLKNALMPLI